LNLNNFNIIESTVLRIISSRSLEWHHLPTKCHENLPSGSKVIGGENTDRHTDVIDKPAFIFGKQDINAVLLEQNFCFNYES
jgi:hypothetical protein